MQSKEEEDDGGVDFGDDTVGVKRPAPEDSAKDELLGSKRDADGGNSSMQAKEEENAAKRQRLDEDGTAAKKEALTAKEETAGVANSSSETKTAILQVKEEAKAEDGSAAASKSGHDDALGEVPTTAWSLEDVTELLTIAMMQNGSRTPTHMGKVLDGYEKVFFRLRSEDEDEQHSYIKTIVRCIFEYWRINGQRLEITLDSLLHRGIVTPRAVVEYALEEFGQVGDSMSIWNMVNSVARKNLEKVISLQEDMAIAKKHEKEELAKKLEAELKKAATEMSDVFICIFSGLVRNHQDLEDKDQVLRYITVQRVLAIGRKYNAFIKPLIKNADSRIPGVAHNPDVSAVFQSLRVL